MKTQVLTAEQAAEWVQDGAEIFLGGFIGSVVAESLARATAERFIATGHPKNLSVVFAAGQGNGTGKAANHFAHPGMLKRVIGGHWGLVPELQKMALANQIEAYNLPQGVISHLLRDSAAGKPGTLSHVGLGTFVDPRFEGGKINEVSREDIVSVMEIEGTEYLFYKKLNVDVAFLRGTTADENGNITMEDECLIVENLAAAQAVKNNGGKVIVQVKQLAKNGELDPHAVKIPGILVDAVVIAHGSKEHMQTFGESYNESYVGIGDRDEHQHVQRELDDKKVIARRAAMFLQKGAILNLGIGAPEVISNVAEEEGVLDQLVLTVEPGGIGGAPAGGLSFGASAFPEAIISQDQQFDFYDGGGLDQAFLGLAECDEAGNINVSRFGDSICGCGGFINITQNAKQVFFCGTFTAGEQNIEVIDGRLVIHKDGDRCKFIEQVQQITFSGKVALERNKPVFYITERAVFKLTEKGLTLIEIAPGVDLERDILAKMSFTPQFELPIPVMDERIFSECTMELELRAVE
ncbi:3-oxoacid CoA-transferase [Vibrio sp. Of7-15]|uniref:acyl CoA:acetate/3-ketoacid CoA transferase n=1 Tax=Vibrio sp. Of7-15 TaxID=2724879 RepID=UPI001EF253D0|nr:CoA-transferase [Vibrio sp. Of7-15]MCG7497297.1 3-oxoacid CoA-transferase [Vibrio sp. Of7-15]